MALCARKTLLLSKLDSNLTPREVEEAIEGEVLDVDVVEEVHVVGVEEEQISKLTANRNPIAKVGKLKLLLLSLLLKRKILLHFLTLLRHNHLNILQTKTLSKVNYVILRHNSQIIWVISK